MCHLSKNLYNVALYSIRQYYDKERKFLRYKSNYHHCKENENYKLLNTDIAQQTMKVVDRSFRSFFNAIKQKRKDQYQATIRIPGYLSKDGYFLLIMPRFKIKDGFVSIPMSREFRDQYGSIGIPFPERLIERTVKEIRIQPKYDCRFFEAEFIYLQEKEHKEVSTKKVLAIDLGLNNFATCIDTCGKSFIIDGKWLKSINQWYNKENARLQSIKDKQGIKGITNKHADILRKRNDRVRDYLGKAARYIINYCIKNGIGNLVIGYNATWKNGINMGTRNNQNFVQIPFWNFKQKLAALCERYGINFLEQEESYTSKASFLDGDKIPTFKMNDNTEYIFSGKRCHRGIYVSSNGTRVNADVNGAANILKKSSHGCSLSEVGSGLLTSHLRIRL